MAGSAKPMSALDALFWHIDTPATPMHIGGVAIVDGAPLRDESGRLRLADIRRHIEARLQHLPRFLQRVAPVPLGLGRPMWVDDENFDIACHVHATVLTGSPGQSDRDALCDLAARLITEPLYHDDPLWEVWLVDGLRDGRVGLVEKAHHSLVDGVSNMEMAAALFDLEPNANADIPANVEMEQPPSSLRRLAGALVAQTIAPVTAAAHVAGAVVRSPKALAADIGDAAAAASELLRPSTLAPLAPFNRPVGSERQLHAVTFELDDIHQIAAGVDSTINNVALAVVAGALRTWLLDQEEPAKDLHALVPMSTHTPEGHLQMGNHIGAMVVDLPVSEPERMRRLHLVISRMDHLKSVHEGNGVAAILAALDHLPPPGLGMLSRAAEHQSILNLVVTNVGHLQPPVYFLGAVIEEMIPIGPLAPGMGLGIAVLAYREDITLAVLVDPAACPNSEVLVAAVQSEVEQLVRR